MAAITRTEHHCRLVEAQLILAASLDARASSTQDLSCSKSSLKLPATHRTQQTMICTWLTEIFLDNINRLHDAPPTPALTAAEEQRRQAMNRTSERLMAVMWSAVKVWNSVLDRSHRFVVWMTVDGEHHSNGLSAQSGSAVIRFGCRLCIGG